MSAVFLYGAVQINELDTTSNNLLFIDLNNFDHYFDNYLLEAEQSIYNLFQMQSEEYIQNMGCLEWESNQTSEIFYNGETITTFQYKLTSKNIVSSWYHGSEPVESIDSQQAQMYIDEAIDIQLQQFRFLQNSLKDEQGLF